LEAALPGLNATLQRYGITTKNEIASFLAQVGHESAQLRYRAENLNYSSKGLMSTFRKYFSSLATANTYARKPVKIANRVYANRMGNGNESSGDGWKHRGRSYIQITGKDNYTLMAKYLGITIDQLIVFLETDEGAWAGAGWYWVHRNLDLYDDDLNVRKETLLINGGTNGEADRQTIMDRAISVL
jgi:putative chitinase